MKQRRKKIRHRNTFFVVVVVLRLVIISFSVNVSLSGNFRNTRDILHKKNVAFQKIL